MLFGCTLRLFFFLVRRIFKFFCLVVGLFKHREHTIVITTSVEMVAWKLCFSLVQMTCRTHTIYLLFVSMLCVAIVLASTMLPMMLHIPHYFCLFLSCRPFSHCSEKVYVCANAPQEHTGQVLGEWRNKPKSVKQMKLKWMEIDIITP